MIYVIAFYNEEAIHFLIEDQSMDRNARLFSAVISHARLSI